MTNTHTSSFIVIWLVLVIILIVILLPSRHGRFVFPPPPITKRCQPDPQKLINTVVIYAYHCRANSTREIENLRFLFNHGNMSAVTMVLVSNGSDIPTFVPRSVYTLKRENKGYDFEAWYHGLQLARTLRDFDKFVFINSSCKGPYLPRWFGVSNMHWTECFTRLISNKTKLVGLTLNNHGFDGKPAFPYAKHIQSMFWVTDDVGIELLLKKKILEENNTRDFAQTIIDKEIGMSRQFIDADFDIVPLGMSDYICDTHGDIHYENSWFGSTLNPLETIFFKNNRISSKYIDYLDLCHTNMHKWE